MRRGRRSPQLELSGEQRSTLQDCTRRRKTAQALSMRARIILRASEGQTATAIATETHACIQTVSEWWRRFAERGLDGRSMSRVPDNAIVLMSSATCSTHVQDQCAFRRVHIEPHDVAHLVVLESVAGFCKRINDSGH